VKVELYALSTPTPIVGRNETNALPHLVRFDHTVATSPAPRGVSSGTRLFSRDRLDSGHPSLLSRSALLDSVLDGETDELGSRTGTLGDFAEFALAGQGLDFMALASSLEIGSTLATRVCSRAALYSTDSTSQPSVPSAGRDTPGRRRAIW
jgi:hypothetical protein